MQGISVVSLICALCVTLAGIQLWRSGTSFLLSGESPLDEVKPTTLGKAAREDENVWGISRVFPPVEHVELLKLDELSEEDACPPGWYVNASHPFSGFAQYKRVAHDDYKDLVGDIRRDDGAYVFAIKGHAITLYGNRTSQQFEFEEVTYSNDVCIHRYKADVLPIHQTFLRYSGITAYLTFEPHQDFTAQCGYTKRGATLTRLTEEPGCYLSFMFLKDRSFDTVFNIPSASFTIPYEDYVGLLVRY